MKKFYKFFMAAACSFLISSICTNSKSQQPIPRSEFFVGASLTKLKYETDKKPMFGAQLAFAWYFRNKSDALPVDQLHMNVGAGVEALYTQYRIGWYEFRLSFLTGGPELHLGKGRFGGSVQLQCGVAREADFVMESLTVKTSFAFKPGAHLEWFFSDRKNIGARLVPQMLMTNFDHNTDWNFIGAAGLVFGL